MNKDIDAQKVFDRLDALSRERSLTDAESLALEQAIRVLDGQGGRIAKREAARVGVKRAPPWSGRPIIERMAEALHQLHNHWSGKRRPKAFYLGPDDWLEFMATDRPNVETVWNNEPSVEPAFNDVPVRASKNVPPRQSRLYDHTTTGRMLPP